MLMYERTSKDRKKERSSSGEAKFGFPANFFSRNGACLFLERANAEDVLLLTTSLYWFQSSTSGYLIVVLDTKNTTRAPYTKVLNRDLEVLEERK